MHETMVSQIRAGTQERQRLFVLHQALDMLDSAALSQLVEDGVAPDASYVVELMHRLYVVLGRELRQVGRLAPEGRTDA